MDDQTIIIILGIGVSFLGLIIRYAFKSKCDRVDLLFGCLSIHREVDQEEKDMENPSDENMKVEDLMK